jgi:hypothetical protein
MVCRCDGISRSQRFISGWQPEGRIFSSCRRDGKRPDRSGSGRVVAGGFLAPWVDGG